MIFCYFYEYLIMKQLEINWHAAAISKRGIEFSKWTFLIDTQEKNVFGGQMWPNNLNDSCSVQTVTYFPVKIEVPAKINLQSSEYSKVNQFSRTVWSRQINGTARVKFEWCDPWNLFRLLYSTIFSIAQKLFNHNFPFYFSKISRDTPVMNDNNDWLLKMLLSSISCLSVLRILISFSNWIFYYTYTCGCEIDVGESFDAWRISNGGATIRYVYRHTVYSVVSHYW